MAHRPRKANKTQERLECDVILMAVGQDIISAPFEKAGIATKRGQLHADASCALNRVGMYAGGDCVTGPATVIKAIAAGKAAAANIDEFLGFHHAISVRNSAERQYQIGYRARPDPASGYWRYDPCVSDRQSSGRDQVGEADSPHAGIA